MSKAVLEFNNVTKSIKKNQLLGGISFNVNQGEFHALIGPNGAGKTTLIKCLIGISNIDSGEIKINGISNQDPKSKQSIGYIPDKMTWPIFMRVDKYLNYMAYLSGLDMKEAKELVLKMLNKYGLEHRANTRVRKISMGEQKKVLLIQSLINKPNLLILDEPTTNLDAINEKLFFDQMKELNDQGVTILIVSHKMELLEKYASSVTAINRGLVIYDDSIKKAINDKTLTDTLVMLVGDKHD